MFFFFKSENNNQLEPIKIEITGNISKDEPEIYLFDYFLFKNRANEIKQNGKLDCCNDFVLDLPLTGCPEAIFLGDLKFSLYLPDILKVQFKKPKLNNSQTDELMDIVFDQKNQLIRVDNFKDNYYEIADLKRKHFYHFDNKEECIPFYYQANYSSNLRIARSFIDQIYKLDTVDFYHIGKKILDDGITAQVFELSQTTNKNKDVTTLYTKEVNMMNCLIFKI